MLQMLASDIDAVMQRDPAARSRLEVILCYPGFHAIASHRLCHWLWRRNVRLPARWLAQVARSITGIEIHPGAVIGSRFFIDHGMGVVIGGTAEIGDDVTLYQGVTLGGTAPAVNSQAQANTKRHPTLKDRVIVGCGAQVLGPITVGEGASVGGNAVVTRDVEPATTVVGIPARVSGRAKPTEAEQVSPFPNYGLRNGDVNDPVLRTIDTLAQEVERLSKKVEDLEKQREADAEARRCA